MSAIITRARLAFLILVLVALISALLPRPVTAAYVPGDDGWGLWDAPPSYNINAVWVDSTSDNVFAVGQGGQASQYDSTTWTTMTTGTTSELVGVWGSSSADVFAVADDGWILYYDGTSWQSMIKADKALTGVWGNSSNDVFAVGNVGTVLHYDGSAWSSMNSYTTSQLNAVWGSSSTDVYAVGNVGSLIHYNGVEWTPMASIAGAHLRGIWGSSPTDIFAVGAGGAIRHYNGTTWSSMTSNTTSELFGVCGSSSSDVFAVGAAGTILHYDGTCWTSMTSGTTNTLRGIHGRGALDVFAVGHSGTLLHYLEQAAPEITRVQPSTGVQGAIVEFTITGTDLGWVSDVTFGDGVTVDSFTAANSTTITGALSIDLLAVIGPRDVSVTTQAGTAVLTGGFTVDQAPPAITAVDPVAGVQGAVLSITITGSYLEDATSVDFGPGINVEALSSSHDCVTANITIASTAAPGPRDITIVTTGGDFTLPGAFTVGPAPPTIASADPGQCQLGETITLTLTGTYLTGATTLDFGPDVVVDFFTVDSPLQMTVHILVEPGADIGARDITVSTPGGTAILAGGFLVTLPPPPTITSVTPLSANQGETIEATITGTGFTTVISLSFGDGIQLNDFTVQSDTEILASITVLDDASPGVRGVSVTNPGGEHILPGGFEVPPPTIISLDCLQGYQGDTLQVVITGKNLSGTSEIDFGPGVTVEGFTVESPDRITAAIRISKTAPEGDRDILITTPGGTTALKEAFVIEEPDAVPVHTWILSGLILGLITFRVALFGLRRRHQEEE